MIKRGKTFRLTQAYHFIDYTNPKELDDLADLETIVNISFTNCSVFFKIPNCHVHFFNCSITSDTFLLFNSKSVELHDCVWTNELIKALKMPDCKVTQVTTSDYSDFGDFHSLKYLNHNDFLLRSIPPFLVSLKLWNSMLLDTIRWPITLKQLHFSQSQLGDNVEIPRHYLDFVRFDDDCKLVRYIKTKEMFLGDIDKRNIVHIRHVKRLVSFNPEIILYAAMQTPGIQDYRLESFKLSLVPRIEAAIHQNRAIFRAAREATLTWMGLRLILRDVARIIGEFIWESRFERDIWIYDK